MKEYTVERFGWDYAYVSEEDLDPNWLKDKDFLIEEYKVYKWDGKNI